MTEYDGVVGEIDTGLEEGLKVRHKLTTQTSKNKGWDAMAACCFEGVQHFDNT